MKTKTVVLTEIDEKLSQSEIGKSDSIQIKSAFETFLNDIDKMKETALKLVVKNEDEVDKIKDAREGRLSVSKIRISADKKRKELKAESIKYGKAVQDVYNLIEDKVKPIEEHLLKQEKFAENLRKERLEKLQQDRVEKLSLYVEDADQRDLAKFEEDEFEAILQMNKKTFEDNIAAEKKAEEDRIAKEKAEKEEQEKIRLENEKLKKAAEEKAKSDKLEADKRAKVEAERLLKEKQERQEREANQAKAVAEHQAQLKAEREKAAKVQAELEAKEAAEIKAKQEQEAKLQAELSKGDADKVKDLIKDLETLKTKYSFKSKKNQTKYKGVSELIDKVIGYINK